MGLLILEQIVKYFLIIFVGYIAVKCGLLKSEESRVLSVLCIYVFAPCAILQSFQIHATMEAIQKLEVSFTAAVLIHGLLLLAGTVFAKLFRMDRVETASVIYSNAGNMILPLVAATMGGEWVLYASAYISVQAVFIWTHGKSMICGEKGIQWKKILLNVNIIAIAAGIVLFFARLEIPRIISDTLSAASGMLAPSVMLSIGMVLAGVDIRKVLQDRSVYFTCAVRLVFMPLLVLLAIYACLPLLSVENAGTLLFVSFLAATTPAAATIAQMAQVYGRDIEHASTINVMSTLLCLATMPVLTGLYAWMIPILP